MKLSIRVKLLASFAVVLMLLVAISITSVTRMNSMGSVSTDIYVNWLPSLLELTEMDKSADNIQRVLLRYVIEPDPARMAALEQELNEAIALFTSQFRHYESSIRNVEERRIYDNFIQAWNNYLPLVNPVLEAAVANDTARANAALNEAQTSRRYMAGLVGELVQFNRAGISQGIEDTNRMIDNSTVVILIVSAAAILIGVGLALFISGAIAKSMGTLTRLVAKVADGDLRETVDIHSKDEIGTLAGSVNEMIAQLRKLIGLTLTSSQSVAAASQQISASSEEIAGSTTNQANAAQTINELFNDLSRAINAVAKSAERAAELSDESKQGAEGGARVVKDSVRSMNLLNEQMSKLQEDSNRIGEIIEVIDDIAEQTNLLALNAAIEAARAGEQGRGFAVVADEVRKLAERSGAATKQIGQIIKGMQNNTETSVKSAKDAVELSRQAGEALDLILGKVNGAAQQVAEIAAASEEQAAQSEEVLRSIESVAAASEEAAAAAEQTATSTQNLTQLAEELNSSVSAFKL